MHLPSSHPDFDLELELLCTLPLEPFSASFKTLCSDFGASPNVLLSHIESLRERGYVLRVLHNTRNPFSIPHVCISGLSAFQALSDAHNYWKKTHPIPEPAPPRQRINPTKARPPTCEPGEAPQPPRSFARKVSRECLGKPGSTP